MSCRNCIHQSVCYLVDSHGLTEMSFHFNEVECFDYINKDVLEKVEQLEKENKKFKEKQTPKRPKKVALDMQDFTTYFECPTCHTHEKCKSSYCRWCGQKLDWSD